MKSSLCCTRKAKTWVPSQFENIFFFLRTYPIDIIVVFIIRFCDRSRISAIELFHFCADDDLLLLLLLLLIFRATAIGCRRGQFFAVIARIRRVGTFVIRCAGFGASSSARRATAELTLAIFIDRGGIAAFRLVVIRLGVIFVVVVAGRLLLTSRPALCNQSARRDVFRDAQHIRAAGFRSFAIRTGSDRSLVFRCGDGLLGSSAAATASASGTRTPPETEVMKSKMFVCLRNLRARAWDVVTKFGIKPTIFIHILPRSLQQHRPHLLRRRTGWKWVL